MKTALSLIAFGLLATASAHAAIVEPFDGAMGPGWATAAGPGGIGAPDPYGAIAPDGGAGWALSDATWAYNTSITFQPGQTLTAWFNPNLIADPAAPSGYDGGGRLYLGFGADASGAYSLMVSSDTTLPAMSFGLQDNSGYGSTDLTSTPFAFADQWYLLAVDWAFNGTVTGTIYDADGTTVLGTTGPITLTGAPNNTPTGIALMGFGGVDVADIAVPEPASLVLLAGGLAGLAAARRRS